MASIKQNFVYNALLTISGYIFPLIVFPYVSRVLGVTNMGACNFVDSIVDYFTIISMMGMNTLGIREIAKVRNDQQQLNKVFSELFSLNTISTIIAVGILYISICYIPKFQGYQLLFYLGTSKLFFNYMLINWFFQGIEDFRFITIRYAVVKVLFVISIFVFVHNSDDTIVYYLIVCISWALNGLINIMYSKNIVSFRFTFKIRKEYVISFVVLGCYWFMNSLYTTLNVAFLGFKTNDTEVGYYTSANKLLCVIIALFTTLSSVIVPRISSMIRNKDNINELKELIEKSFSAVILFAIPLTIYVFYYSYNIIFIIFGFGFEGSIIPLQIMSLLFLFMGINQILVLQILMPLGKDKDILRNSTIAGLLGGVAVLVLVTFYGKIGASIELLIGEVILFIGSLMSVRKYSKVEFPLSNIIKHILIIFPIIIIYMIINNYIGNLIMELLIAGVCTLIYVTCIEMYVFKNKIIIDIINKLI